MMGHLQPVPGQQVLKNKTTAGFSGEKTFLWVQSPQGTLSD